MTCNLDHSSQRGKFCKGCGVKLGQQFETCSSGHEIKKGARFCSICGEQAKKELPEPKTVNQLSSPVTFNVSYPTIPIPPIRAKTNSLAITSFVLSIICCSPLGVILGSVALSQINKDPSQTGRGLAIAAIILGSIGTIFLLFNFTTSFWYF
jgi:hypothetical protein